MNKMVDCPKCKSEMKRIRKLDELPCFPVEWWVIGNSLFDNELVFYCDVCSIVKTLSYIDKIKYKISKMIAGDLI